MDLKETKQRKLSIITVNLNNAAGLKKTIESVIGQTYTDYEYIVIDGGSTDGSVDIIKQYADKITYWVSEPDKGIYHAMNKGILQAKGAYCQFLNSGDRIIDQHGLQHVFDKKPVEDIIYCDMTLGDITWTMPEQFTFAYFFIGSIGHPSTFIKTSLFSSIGLYNEENRIVSDWEFFTKAIIESQCSYQHIPYFLIYFDTGGISENPVYKEQIKKEREKILKENYPLMYDDYQHLSSLRQEIESYQREILPYQTSRVIQFVRRIQLSGFYTKMIRFIS